MPTRSYISVLPKEIREIIDSSAFELKALPATYTRTLTNQSDSSTSPGQLRIRSSLIYLVLMTCILVVQLGSTLNVGIIGGAVAGGVVIIVALTLLAIRRRDVNAKRRAISGERFLLKF